jgi:hypothetical protein
VALPLPDLSAWTPDDWSAFGTNFTALIALAAGIVAWRQLREARRLRLEQAQPYVVCFAERTPGHDQALDIVIRNFGTTAARDIALKVTPPLMRSGHAGNPPEEVKLPAALPVLVPGQEWRTWWDLGISRAEVDLVSRHDAVVSYKDSQGKPLPPTPSVIDWEDFSDRTWLVTYGVHEVATALRDLSKTVASFKYRMSGGLAAYVRDADVMDRREREEWKERRQHHEALKAEVKQAQQRWRQQQGEAETSHEAADELPGLGRAHSPTEPISRRFSAGWWRSLWRRFSGRR